MRAAILELSIPYTPLQFRSIASTGALHMRNGSRSYLQGLVYKNVVTVTFSLHVHLVGLRARFNRCAIPRTIIKEYYWGGGGGGGPPVLPNYKTSTNGHPPRTAKKGMHACLSGYFRQPGVTIHSAEMSVRRMTSGARKNNTLALSHTACHPLEEILPPQKRIRFRNRSIPQDEEIKAYLIFPSLLCGIITR